MEIVGSIGKVCVVSVNVFNAATVSWFRNMLSVETVMEQDYILIYKKALSHYGTIRDEDVSGIVYSEIDECLKFMEDNSILMIILPL